MNELDQAESVWSRVATVMKPLIGERDYDEVAIMVEDDATADVLLYGLEEELLGGVFNRSSDTAHVWPIRVDYDVTYRFFQPNTMPFRLEVMTIDKGISPAHLPAQERLRDEDEFVIMHVSYKPAQAGLEAYEAEKRELEGEGLTFVQECRSTYGIFSYWMHPDLPDGVYVKPRVNLRDPADPLQRVTDEQIFTAAERRSL